MPGGGRRMPRDYDADHPPQRGRRAMVLGRGVRSVRPGTRRPLAVDLKRAAVATLRRRGVLQVAMGVTVTRSGSTPASARAQLTLRSPRG